METQHATGIGTILHQGVPTVEEAETAVMAQQDRAVAEADA